jgi:nucleoside 2-deoxyribosyltransferase
MIVYLAGPINGCTDCEANSWREQVKDTIGAENCLDPMRRDYRGHEDTVQREIVENDKEDIFNADVVLAYCWQVSVGTSMEVLLAWEMHKPVIVVVPADMPVSPWLRYHATIVHSLPLALRKLSELQATAGS